ncbi:MAG TPA: redoxin domain-containing protein [Rhizomicrobium sp.]|nr:redoxin domain-containing protein [Rhizomicrobium sp.]
MKKLLLGVAFGALFATPSFAALKVGDTAPDFTATASLGGKDFTFHLNDALKKGPVVVYFYPSAYTGGCDLEAHTFAENREKFDTAGASIIGVSADNLERLNQFSADPNFCAGKFPIASDESLKIANSYNLQTTPAQPGAKDVRGVEIGHGFIERVTFVVGQDHKIVAVMSSKDDKIKPDEHVFKSLAMVEKLK